MVLQHVVLGIGPVVRDVRAIMVAHHLGRRSLTLPSGAIGAGGIRQVGAVRAATQGFTDETIQLAAVDIGSHVDLLVRTAGVAVLVVEVRLDALVGQGIGHADRGDTVVPGDAVGAGIGAKVAVEGAVLLHDDNHVLDGVDAAGRRPAGGPSGSRLVGLCRARAQPGSAAQQEQCEAWEEKKAPASHHSVVSFRLRFRGTAPSITVGHWGEWRPRRPRRPPGFVSRVRPWARSPLVRPQRTSQPGGDKARHNRAYRLRCGRDAVAAQPPEGATAQGRHDAGRDEIEEIIVARRLLSALRPVGHLHEGVRPRDEVRVQLALRPQALGLAPGEHDQEELAVGGRKLEQGVHPSPKRGTPLSGRAPGVAHGGCEGLAQCGEAVTHDGTIQGVLAAEVQIERAEAHVGGLGDLSDGRVGHAVPGEDGASGAQQARPNLRLTPGPTAWGPTLCPGWTLAVLRPRLSWPITRRTSSMVILLSYLIDQSRSPVKQHRNRERAHGIAGGCPPSSYLRGTAGGAEGWKSSSMNVR